MGAALASQQGGFLQNKPALIDECGERDDHSLSSSSAFFLLCRFPFIADFHSSAPAAAQPNMTCSKNWDDLSILPTMGHNIVHLLPKLCIIEYFQIP